MCDMLNLNLGCGEWYVPDWINVDWESPHPADMRVDLRGELPFAHGTVTHVYAGHLLEHLTRDEAMALAQRLLPLMDPLGGLFVAVGPDVEVARRMAAAGTLDTTHHTLDTIVQGGGRWPGDQHRWETTGPGVAELLRDAGWPVVADVGIASLSTYWPVADREPAWQYAVRAYVGEPQPW